MGEQAGTILNLSIKTFVQNFKIEKHFIVHFLIFKEFYNFFINNLISIILKVFASFKFKKIFFLIKTFHQIA